MPRRSGARALTQPVHSLGSGGRYLLVEAVGSGAMAVVYRGHDTELDRPVAVKVLAESLAADPTLRRRFVREARLAASVVHPNIVRVYDYGEAAGRPYIVMEYVDGETLGELLARRGRVEAAEAMTLLGGVCSALARAHAAGLVHRDVKPQNLLVDRNGAVKIADFGIARVAGATRLTQVGTVLGTPAYLAPEQARGEDAGPPADVYAVGVVLYQLVTGQLPFDASTVEQLVAMQPRVAPASLRASAPSTPVALEDVVMRCLAYLPEYRPAAGDVARALAAIAAGVATRVLPAARRRRRRPRAVVAALVAGAALVAVAIGIGAGLQSGGEPPRRPTAPATTSGSETALLRSPHGLPASPRRGHGRARAGRRPGAQASGYRAEHGSRHRRRRGAGHGHHRADGRGVSAPA